MTPRRLSSRPRSSFIIGLAAAALGACAGAESGDDGDSSVPSFQGAPPAAAAGGASSNPGPVASAGASGSVTEQLPGNLPIAGGAGGSGATPAGTGGSSSAPVATAGNGGAPPVTPPPAGGTGGAGGSPAGAGGAQAPTEPEPPPPADPFPAPAGPGCGPSAFFCEDFEDFAVGAAQQNAAWRPEGNASIDGQASQGARALRLQPSGGQFARITLANFSAPNNSLFGRMFLRIEALPSAPNFAHWVVVEATGTGSSERVRPLGGQYIEIGDRNIRSNFWGIGADGGPTGDWTHWDNGGLVEARAATYQCIEWRMNGADSAIDVWIDEQFQPSMSVSRDNNPRNTPFIFPTFNNMTIGWGVFQGGTTPGQFDVHVDDIVLSSERAGCN
jgi:hypothetical protein